jgi:hypothetical protein
VIPNERLPRIRAILTIAAIIASIYSQAQPAKGNNPLEPMSVGAVTLNAGLGIGSDYKGDYYSTAFGAKIAAEWGLWHAGPGVITLGGEIGGSFSNGGYYANYAARTEVLGARAAWHHGWKVPGLDTYGGFAAGVGLHHFEYNHDIGYNGTDVFPVFGVFFGASYFVTTTFGFNAEFGYDITDFQFGVIFKLK